MYDHDKHGYQCYTNDLVRMTMIIQKNHNMSWAYDHDKDYYPNDLDQFFAHDIDDCYEPDNCNHDYDDHYDHDVWSLLTWWSWWSLWSWLWWSLWISW